MAIGTHQSRLLINMVHLQAHELIFMRWIESFIAQYSSLTHPSSQGRFRKIVLCTLFQSFNAWSRPAQTVRHALYM